MNATESARIVAVKSGRFRWDRVQVAAGCWPWLGSVNRWGYGDCVYEGKRMNASRAAYAATYGPIAPGLVICHSCDNPLCCNPAHLRADTQASNLAECRAKGRARYCLGADHHRATAKLTPERVTEAKRLYASGVTQTEIARRFGVHSATISRTVRGENWAHIK